MTTEPTALLDREPTDFPGDIPSPVIRQYWTDGRATRFVSSSPDVYDALGDFASLGVLPDLDGFTVTTTGWAAPLDENGNPQGAPSAHAERRRVALIVAVTRGGVCSRIMFADDPENPMDDPGTATGSLAAMVLRVGLEVFGNDSEGLAEPLARLMVADLIRREYE